MHGRCVSRSGPDLPRRRILPLLPLDSGDTWTHGAHTVHTSMMHSLVLTQQPGDTRRPVPMGHRAFPRAC
eukprot:3362198-Prymnesium_polylepis.2